MFHWRKKTQYAVIHWKIEQFTRIIIKNTVISKPTGMSPFNLIDLILKNVNRYFIRLIYYYDSG